jgi:hypothetical protein
MDGPMDKIHAGVKAGQSQSLTVACARWAAASSR